MARRKATTTTESTSQRLRRLGLVTSYRTSTRPPICPENVGRLIYNTDTAELEIATENGWHSLTETTQQ